MTRWCVATLGLSVVFGCGGPPWAVPPSEPAPHVEVQRAPVVGGRLEAGYPSVGYLVAGTPTQLSGPTCGATLLAPDVAVTAGHCVQWAFTYGVELAPGVRRVARRVFTHPDYRPNDPLDRRFRHDVAVLILESPFTNVTLATLGTVGPGEVARFVGYGRTTPGPQGTGPSGERRSAQQRVTQLDGTSIRVTGVDGGLCWGDSGGPLMAEGQDVVFGVLADFDGEFYCRSGNAMIFTSLTGEATFLRAAMACASSTDPSCLTRQLASPCRATDAAGCAATPGCGWYPCAQACAPSGTLVKDLCPDAYCAQFSAVPGLCAAAGPCAWHDCTSTCWSKAASPVFACAPSAPAASAMQRFCPNGCFLAKGRVTQAPDSADACADAATKAQDAAGGCWSCDPALGWVEGAC